MGGAEERRLPEPSFDALVAGLATQALLGMGALKPPPGHEVRVDLDHAKFTIELLRILRERTKGNLSAEEESALDELLHDLRMRYVAALSSASPKA
ncbi:MAG: DUF1844 domain-containing protein [Planctomycetales bacterium]|nr:DUF1844 domain-containing protein [Planctomycetales bacterium]